MVLDIGGGAAEAAVISLGGGVVHKSVRVAGNKVDEAIIGYVRKNHNLIIGDQTAEHVKLQIGSALPLAKDEVMEVKGRDYVQGLPRTIHLSAREVTEAIEKPLMQIVAGGKGVMEGGTPGFSSGIIYKRVVMTGGTCMLRNFDALLTRETGVPCHVAEDAILCVARGTGIALEHLDLYKRSVTKK